jgi:hypothetical protein
MVRNGEWIGKNVCIVKIFFWKERRKMHQSVSGLRFKPGIPRIRRNCNHRRVRFRSLVTSKYLVKNKPTFTSPVWLDLCIHAKERNFYSFLSHPLNETLDKLMVPHNYREWLPQIRLSSLLSEAIRGRNNFIWSTLVFIGKQWINKYITGLYIMDTG